MVQADQPVLLEGRLSKALDTAIGAVPRSSRLYRCGGAGCAADARRRIGRGHREDRRRTVADRAPMARVVEGRLRQHTLLPPGEGPLRARFVDHEAANGYGATSRVVLKQDSLHLVFG